MIGSFLVLLSASVELLAVLAAVIYKGALCSHIGLNPAYALTQLILCELHEMDGHHYYPIIEMRNLEQKEALELPVV